LTRAFGLGNARILLPDELETFDVLHYEVENKLLALIKSVEAMRTTDDWKSHLPT
jgi:hypothetical protein